MKPFGRSHSIALFGLSANPIHKGHYDVVVDALHKLPKAHFVILPTLQNPLKNPTEVSFDDRIEMCRMMFSGFPSVQVSTFERDFCEAPYYTSDTLLKIREFYPAEDLWLIVGADTVVNLYTWHNSAQIAHLAHILSFPRTEQSSTAVRQAIMDNDIARAQELVGNERVLKYIETRQLYK